MSYKTIKVTELGFSDVEHVAHLNTKESLIEEMREFGKSLHYQLVEFETPITSGKFSVYAMLTYIGMFETRTKVYYLVKELPW